MPDRDVTISTIQRELTAFARRARQKAARIHPGLSLVTYTMLDHMRETGGCRGTDLAEHFLLDKSTVSRQTAVLERLGLIVREPDPDDRRGQILRPSEDGLRLLDEAHQQRRATFEERFTEWGDEDLERFSGYLQRYNAVS
ncbi:MarR family winged helix-turn-helix transcriptional regulator [Streptomyces olivoreticuli]|uniref:MarR family winged helix-turn-helix transcriptional regulator n=1 Tax=Streptomyces blastmyceticus TaxID=68180 RepID=A0ABN0XIC5_9ACTN|nr:MarR family winged helix-turn-helix transcriptional regulator [Streptomyces olivoreticuli]WKK24632.1 MarR family winged helix-turn-helix transcriptional regulator [Streptomyces olivoreticuli]